MWRFFLACFCRHGSGATGARFEAGNHHRKRGMLYFTLSLLLFLFAGQLSAQSVTSLRGAVFDGDDGSPLTGATVEIQGAGYVSVSDEYGHFGFDHIPAGEYILKVSAPGYESVYRKD
ncbi:MAG: hypothetical protein DRP46_02990, partial [Candidatus Zixiibacteriota bacterium]